MLKSAASNRQSVNPLDQTNQVYYACLTKKGNLVYEFCIFRRKENLVDYMFVSV